jgi:hypothetical protein
MFAAATPAFAGQGEHLSVYGGHFEISDDENDSAMLGVEYRFADQFNGLRPVVGAFGNADSGAYVYGGAYWDLPLGTAPFVITPGFAAGYYNEGASKDLGYDLEFRSTLEISYEFDSGNRLGVAISHLSNAGIGDSNPGTETVQLVYSYPLW